MSGFAPLHALPQWAVSQQVLKAVGLHNHWPEPQWVYTNIDQNLYGFIQLLTRTSMGLLNHWPELQWVYSTIDQNLNGNHWLGSLWVYTTTGQNLCGSIQPLTRTFETVCWNRSLLFPNSLRINFYRLLTDTIRLGWGRKTKQNKVEANQEIESKTLLTLKGIISTQWTTQSNARLISKKAEFSVFITHVKSRLMDLTKSSSGKESLFEVN